MTDIRTTPEGVMPIGRHDARRTVPGGRHPYPAQEPAETADPSQAVPDEQAEHEPAAPPTAPAEPRPAPPQGEPGPLAQWLHAARADSTARKTRGGGKPWAARWMREQPTSVADLLDYYLNQREERPDGRRGWGLRTSVPAVNSVHAAAYVTFGLVWALGWTLVLYALAWMQQRPGRAALLVAGLWIVTRNISAVGKE